MSKMGEHLEQRLDANKYEMYDALIATNKYFKACVEAWAEGDHMMPEDEQSVRVESDELDNLCDEAAELTASVIIKVEGKL